MKNKLLIIFNILLLMSIILNLNFIKADISTCSPQINLVSQDPVSAAPGSYVKVVFEVSNLGYCSAGFAVKLDSKYPFSLDNGTNPVQYITSLPYVAGNYQTTWDVGYNVRIADDAIGQNYTLSLLSHQGTGSDFTYSSVEQGFTIGITDERTTFDSVIQSVSGSQVSIGIANTGKYAANAVIVKIPSQTNFRTVGTNGQIVGNLQSGDYTIVNFNLASTRTFAGTAGTQRPANIQNSSSSNNELQFEIDYTDNIGTRRIVNMQLPVSLLNSSTTGNFPGKTRSSWSVWYTVLIIAGVLVVLFILYKKFPKQAKKITSRIFRRKKHQENNSGEVPEWVKKEKGKVK
jgi:hypothetical protein